MLFSGLLVAAMLDMFSTSTGSLLLLVLPIAFCVALFPFACLGVLVHWLRGRWGFPSDPRSGWVLRTRVG